MTDSVLTLTTNGGTTGWDQMCLGYDGIPFFFTVTQSVLVVGQSSMMFSLSDAAVAGDISKIVIAYRAASNPQSGRESYVYCQTKVDGDVYETAGVVHSNATTTWYYMDIATNPATSQAWEWGEIDSLQAGMRCRVTYGGNIAIYQFKVQVYYEPDTYEDTTGGGANVGISPGGMVM